SRRNPVERLRRIGRSGRADVRRSRRKETEKLTIGFLLASWGGQDAAKSNWHPGGQDAAKSNWHPCMLSNSCTSRYKTTTSSEGAIQPPKRAPAGDRWHLSCKTVGKRDFRRSGGRDGHNPHSRMRLP